MSLRLQESRAEQEQLRQTNHDLSAQLRAAQEEAGQLGVELETLKEELSLAKSSAGCVVCIHLHVVKK